MKNFMSTIDHLNLLSSEMFGSTYEKLSRLERDKVFPFYKEEATAGVHCASTLEECMRFVDLLGLNYKEMVKHYDNTAMGDNFAVVAPDNSIVGIFLPNEQYDTFCLEFVDERTGTNNIEEFNTYRSMMGYLKEQFENLI